MTNRSSVLAASFAILIASPGTAQPEPFSYSDACSTLHVRGDEAVLLSRLCADSFYEAREVAAADAACGAASERFEEVASATTELSVEGKLDECLAVQTREEQLRIARDWGTIAQLSHGLMHADTETWSALAQSLTWFTIIGIGDSAGYLDAEPFTRFLIRLLQFRVAAAEGDDERALQILDTFEAELPLETPEVPLLMARYFFLANVVLRTETKLPMSRLFDVGLEFAALSDRFAAELAEASSTDFDELMAGPDGRPDHAGLFGFNLARRIESRADFEALLEAIEGRDDAQVLRLLWLVGSRETTGGLVLDRIWLAEREQATPDWAGLRDLFERTAAAAKEIGLSGLSHAAARQVVRIDFENLKDPEAALKTADAFGADLGWSPYLENEKASVLLNSDRPAEALEIWRPLLTCRSTRTFEVKSSQGLSCVATPERVAPWRQASMSVAVRGRRAASAKTAFIRTVRINSMFSRLRSTGGVPAGS